MPQESSGLLDGVPYIAVGEGPPLVLVEGLTPTSEVPTGLMRRMTLSGTGVLTRDFRVYWVNRKQGLAPGESMSEIAGHLAGVIEEELGEPVFLTGRSTGGSVALQLAVDRPELVRGLVVVAAAYRLGPLGREVQQELARSIRAGNAAEGWARVITATMLPTRLQGPAQPLVRVMTRPMAAKDPTESKDPSDRQDPKASSASSDLLVTLDAEDAFDVRAELHRITAPTLVIGGGKDVFYTRELFEETAAGVQDGRAHIAPGWGHNRTCMSSTTTAMTLGFFLAALRD